MRAVGCGSLSGVNLGKTIERMIGKIKKAGARETPMTSPSDSAVVAASLVPRKVYLKSLALSSLDDLGKVKDEVKSGNIMIVRVNLLAEKSADDVNRAVSELSEFTGQIGGDIARLGEERVIVTPSFVRVWRENAEADRENV